MLKKIMQLVEKTRFKIKLREIDDIYYITGQSCFSLFPPSFYYTHTPEEIERITQEEIRKIKELIEQMDQHSIDD